MKKFIYIVGLCLLLCVQGKAVSDSGTLTQDSLTEGKQDQNDVQQSALESSQEVLGRVFTLGEILQKAKNNYNLEAKDLAILQAKAIHRAAYGEFLPTLNGGYQYQHTDNPTMRLQSHTASIKANWEVFSGFKTYNKVKEKSSLYRASIEDKQSAQDQLFLNVIDEYYGYFTNRAQLASLDQKRIQLQSNIKRAEQLYRSGLATIDDVESLRAEVLSTEYEIANLKMNIEQNKLLLSLYANTEVQELERKTIKPPLLKLDENRHDINALAERTLSAKYQARQINYWPIVSVSDTYSVNSDIAKKGALVLKDPTQRPDEFLPLFARQFPPNQNQIMISASIQLDALTTYRQYEATRLDYLKSLKELAYKKEEQRKDEKLYRKALEIAQVQIRASEAALRSASVAFQNVAKKYDAQILNFTDYLQSLTKKFEAEATYNQALNNYERQKAYYIYYSGQDLEAYIQ